jgi:hypothetical protein
MVEKGCINAGPATCSLVFDVTNDRRKRIMHIFLVKRPYTMPNIILILGTVFARNCTGTCTYSATINAEHRWIKSYT